MFRNEKEAEATTNTQTKIERDREIAREALKELLREKVFFWSGLWHQFLCAWLPRTSHQLHLGNMHQDRLELMLAFS